MKSADFEAFEKSFTSSGTRDWIDGFDLGALGRLAGDERLRAEEMLIDRLHRAQDARAVDALAALGSPRAMATVRASLNDPRSSGYVLAYAASALAREDRPAALAAALKVLRLPRGGERSTAVQVLRRLSGEEVVKPLLEAAGDPEFNVRCLAIEGLFDHYHLRGFDVRRRGLGLLRMRLSSPLEAIRRAALVEFSAVIAGLRAGKSPEELGLRVETAEDSPAYLAFLKSCRSDADAPDAEDYDLDAFDRLDPDDRSWAELALLSSLARDFDHRVPRALLHMRCRLAVPLLAARAAAVLEWGWRPSKTYGDVTAAGARQEGRFGVEVARALWLLAGREEGEPILKRLEGHTFPEVQERARAALAELGGEPPSP